MYLDDLLNVTADARNDDSQDPLFALGQASFQPLQPLRQIPASHSEQPTFGISPDA
jgi:hypothetical protein